MEITKTERLREYFKLKSHTSLTKKKLWIYSELLQEDIFMEADELFIRLYEKNCKVSLSTVYAALKKVDKLGLMQKLNPDKKVSAFKINIEKLN